MNNALSENIISNPSCELMVTTRCNMKCTYCIAADLQKSDMSKDTGIAAIDYFIYLSEGAEVLDFIFTGGEPLLNINNLKELIEYSVSNTNANGMGAKISIKTNGTLINNECVELFKKYMCTVFVSIDGTETDHNQFRVPNDKVPYKQIIKNMELLYKNGINCIASMTVHPNSAKHILDGVNDLLDYGFSRINIAPAYGTVNWSNENTESFINSLMDVARLIEKEKAHYQNLEIGPIYENTEHHNFGLRGQWGCSAGSSNIAILPNGEIYGCSSLAMISNRKPGLSIGNVVSGIDQPKLNSLINIVNADCTSRGKCYSCTSKDNCYGGCLAINYSTTESVFDSPPIYCSIIANLQKAWEIAWGETNA